MGNDCYLIDDIPGLHVTSRKYTSVFSSDKIKPCCGLYPELDAADDEEDNKLQIEDNLLSAKAKIEVWWHQQATNSRYFTTSHVTFLIFKIIYCIFTLKHLNFCLFK